MYACNQQIRHKRKEFSARLIVKFHVHCYFSFSTKVTKRKAIGKSLVSVRWLYWKRRSNWKRSFLDHSSIVLPYIHFSLSQRTFVANEININHESQLCNKYDGAFVSIVVFNYTTLTDPVVWRTISHVYTFSFFIESFPFLARFFQLQFQLGCKCLCDRYIHIVEYVATISIMRTKLSW